MRELFARYRNWRRENRTVADAALAGALALGAQYELWFTTLIGEPKIVHFFASLLITIPLAWRQRAPLAVILLVNLGAATQGLLAGAPHDLASLIALLVAVYSTARHGDRRVAFAGAGATAIGLALYESRTFAPLGFAFASLLSVVAWVTGRVVNAYQAQAQALAEALERERALLRELQAKTEQLAAASRHKSEFLASMSHELRTPLNAIIGFTEVVLQRMVGELSRKQEEYLGDVLASSKHLLSLINDILDLSKVEAGKMELELGAVSLPEILRTSLLMVQERAAKHGLALVLDIDPAVETIEADGRKLKQVLLNLLSNAVKFTPDGGRVEVGARLVDTEVRVTVRDTGVGIAPEDLGRIFEEFQQAKHGVRTQEGTGLGLTLTKRIVELHGGRIWVESELDRGSTFAFALPLRAAAAAR